MQRVTRREGAYFTDTSFDGHLIHVEFEMDEGDVVEIKRINGGPTYPHWGEEDLEEIKRFCADNLFQDEYDYWYPLYLGEVQAGLAGKD